MRPTILLATLIMLGSCGAPDPEQADDRLPQVEEGRSAPSPMDPVGLFRDTLPCADCPGILCELWVRDNGSYVILETYLDRDTIPFGGMGAWEVQGDTLLILDPGGSSRWFIATEDGLGEVGADGRALSTSLPTELQRTTGILRGRAMRIKGTYTYANESHSMAPCGYEKELPLGMQQAGMEMAMWYIEGEHDATRPLVVEILAHLGEGPAMEGNEQEEYLFVDKVLRQVKDGCPTPIGPL